MRKRALLGTAALLAGVAMASAQTMPQGESQSGMSSQSGGQAPQMQQQRGGESQRGMQQQRGESRDGMRAQQRQEPAQDRTSGQAQRESEPRRDAQPKQQSEKQQSDQQKDRTSGQAQRDSEPRRDAQPKQQDAQRDRQQDRTQDRAGTRDRGNQDKAAARPDDKGRVTLNSEQRTRIQKTVFASANLPRVSRVDFALSVGTVIPTHVTIVDVPPALIEINPSWRSHKFFVVEEDIIVVSPERKIVAVVPVGRDRAGISSAGSSALALAEDLPPEEIRIVQQVLIDRGFDVEVDGVFGTRTRQALISFQRREGLQATGSIDTRTVAKLGVQDRVKVKGDADRAGSSASGQANRQQDPQQREFSRQGRDAKQQPQQRETSGQAQRETSGQDRGAKQSQQRESSGQGGGDAKQPQQRETSGQGSSDAKQHRSSVRPAARAAATPSNRSSVRPAARAAATPSSNRSPVLRTVALSRNGGPAPAEPQQFGRIVKILSKLNS